jgi:hypothetical protein
MDTLFRDAAWAAAHPAGGVPRFSAGAIRRMGLANVLGLLEDMLDIYNASLEPLATVDLARHRADRDLERVVDNAALVVDELWRVGGRLDIERIAMEWSTRLRHKYLLYRSHRAYVLELATLGDRELEETLFDLIDTVILVHSICAYTDTELVELRRRARPLLLFDALHAMVAHLQPNVQHYACASVWIPWTDDQHHRFLYALGVELAYRFAGRVVCWDTVTAHDPFGVVRAIYPYYVGEHLDVTLGVLRRHASFPEMFRRTIYCLTFVIGYVGPYPLRQWFDELARTGAVPGGCEEDGDHHLQALADFVLAWFYNDADGHRRSAFAREMPRWPCLPVGERADDAVIKAGVSMYAYYTPDPFQLPQAVSVMFCAGGNTFDHALCKPADPGHFQEEETRLPPPPPEDTWIPLDPERGLVGAKAALMHGLGQMALALSHARGRLDGQLARKFGDLLAVDPCAAAMLVNAATSSPRRARLLRRMEAIAVAMSAPDRILRLIRFEAAEAEGTSTDVLEAFGVQIPLHGDTVGAGRSAVDGLTTLVRDFDTLADQATRRIESLLAQPMTPADGHTLCDEWTVRLIQRVLCPDKLDAMTELLRSSRPTDAGFVAAHGPEAMWGLVRAHAAFDDAARVIGDRVREAGAIATSEARALLGDQAAPAIGNLTRLDVLVFDREQDRYQWSPRFHL